MNADYRWWGIFVGQVVTGLLLVIFVPDMKTFGVGILGSAFGQGATATINPTK